MSTLIDKIQKVVSEIPIVVTGTKLGKEDAETFIWKLLSDSRIGIQKNDPETHALLTSSLVTEYDFRKIFCDEANMALPSARALMKSLLIEDQKETPKEEKPGIVDTVVNLLTANKPIGQYSTKELLEKYDADSPQDTWDELSKRAKGNPCIIFEKGSVNVKLSLHILQTIRKGLNFGTTYNDGDKTHRVYPVGVFPEESALCCPLTGKILNNGYSPDLDMSWAGVSEDCLVFISIIRGENPRETFGKFVAKALLKTAKEGLEALKKEYSKEALVYDELKALNQLPSLRVSLNSLATGRKIGTLSDPFGSPRRV
jgi:hypothetical protein